MLEIEKDQVVGVLNRILEAELACRPLHPLFIAGIRIWPYSDCRLVTRTGQ
jgi:hypothetical protein